MSTSKDFTHMCMLFNLLRNVLNYSNQFMINSLNFNWVQQSNANLEQEWKGHTYTNLRPGQYLTHVHSCFALIGAHWYSVHVAVGPMNGRNPCLKDPLLLWQMQSTTLFFCSFFFVTLQYITICYIDSRFLSAPGTIVHGSIRLKPRSLASLQGC